MLDERGIPVAGMFLFDAVDRTAFLENVRKRPANPTLAPPTTTC